MPAFESHWYDVTNKKKLFWILQLSGWGVVILVAVNVLGQAARVLWPFFVGRGLLGMIVTSYLVRPLARWARERSGRGIGWWVPFFLILALILSLGDTMWIRWLVVVCLGKENLNEVSVHFLDSSSPIRFATYGTWIVLYLVINNLIESNSARQQLCRLLAPYAGIEILGEVSGVSEAIPLSEWDPPEVVFLDISMPPESGFDLLPHLPLATRVVFVTAHASHAVRAFEENSLDYLLKPITPERLALTMKRLGENGLLPADDRHLLLGDGGSLVKLPLAHISAVFAEGNYSRVHSMEGEKFLLRRPLRDWLSELEVTHLLQLNRSILVNPTAILQLEKQGRDGGILRLQGIEEATPLGRQAMRLAARAMALGAAI